MGDKKQSLDEVQEFAIYNPPKTVTIQGVTYTITEFLV